MVGVSNTELNLTHFYTNYKFVSDLWDNIAEMNLKQHWSFEKVLFGEVVGEIIILILRIQYMATHSFAEVLNRNASL